MHEPVQSLPSTVCSAARVTTPFLLTCGQCLCAGAFDRRASSCHRLRLHACFDPHTGVCLCPIRTHSVLAHVMRMRLSWLLAVCWEADRSQHRLPFWQLPRWRSQIVLNKQQAKQAGKHSCACTAPLSTCKPTGTVHQVMSTLLIAPAAAAAHTPAAQVLHVAVHGVNGQR